MPQPKYSHKRPAKHALTLYILLECSVFKRFYLVESTIDFLNLTPRRPHGTKLYCFLHAKYSLPDRELLVVGGVFRKVVARYLRKGHTLEDTGQMFSRTGACIRDKNIGAIPELHAAPGFSFTPQPIVSHIDSTINTKALFEVYQAPSTVFSAQWIYCLPRVLTCSLRGRCLYSREQALVQFAELRVFTVAWASGGFLRPDLSLDLEKMTTPPLVRKNSTEGDAHRMTRRMQAVARRISSQVIMEALITLIARLTLGGEVPRAWNLNTSAEMNSHYTRDAVYMRETAYEGGWGE